MTRIERKLRKHLTPQQMEQCECSRNQVEIRSTSDTNELELLVGKVTGWGGYGTGHGSTVLKKGYEPSGDWNDKSSRHHY